MREEALARIHDADILSQSPDRASDSDAVIRILGFEILMKAAIRHSTGKVATGHKYWALWSQLPKTARDQILARAKTEMPGHTDFTDLENLFKSWRYVFEKARYYYELLDGYSLEESEELGTLWVELGSPTEEAMVQYHPTELVSIIAGLDDYLSGN